MLRGNILSEHIGYYDRVGRNIVGTQVRNLRRTASPRITQDDLVARLQLLGVFINQSALSKLEAGRRPVSDIEVAALAKALNVPLRELFSTEGSLPRSTEDRQETSLAASKPSL